MSPAWLHYLTVSADVGFFLVRALIAGTILYLLFRVKVPSRVAASTFLAFVCARATAQILKGLHLSTGHPTIEIFAELLSSALGLTSAALWVKSAPGIVRLIAAARESEERYRKLMEKNEFVERLLRASADPIYSFDTSCRVTAWNPAMERFTGVDHSRAIGRTIFELFPEFHREDLRPELYEQTLAGQSLYIEEERFKRPSGEMGWIEANWTPLRSLTGEITGGLCVFRDITERKKREALVLQQQQQLVESAKLKALGEMAGGMAHEINTPVATIVLKSNELRKIASAMGKGSEPVTGIAEKIYATAMRIAGIIQSLRTFARESGRDPFETVEVEKVVREALILCEARFRRHDIDLDIRLKTLDLQCRPVQIVQVLVNLLNNAFDAVVPREKRIVRIAVEDLGPMVRISVSDNGVGVPDEMLPKLMQPFATSKGVGKGTGLGLSISKGIVEGHGGRLTFEKQSGLTCFSICLPKFQYEVIPSLGLRM